MAEADPWLPGAERGRLGESQKGQLMGIGFPFRVTEGSKIHIQSCAALYLFAYLYIPNDPDCPHLPPFASTEGGALLFPGGRGGHRGIPALRGVGSRVPSSIEDIPTWIRISSSPSFGHAASPFALI